MIDSLGIRNYKNIQNLDLENLGRVNLFTGKNNVGKSSLLEALAIYISQGDTKVIGDILINRGEFKRRNKGGNDRNTPFNIASSLFYNREVHTNRGKEIIIGYKEPNLFENNIKNEESVIIRFVQFYEEKIEDDDSSLIRRRNVIQKNEEVDKDISTQIGLQVLFRNRGPLIFLEEGRFEQNLYRDHFIYRDREAKRPVFQFIKSSHTSIRENAVLWDNIALSNKESYVIEGLKIIESKIERVTFIGESPNERSPIVKLEENNHAVPLQSMGDGINRIMSVILAAVNSEGGYLLIDEFENGLHYTVQEDLWKIIFKLAEALNIQVFATTHSSDCVHSFEKVLNSVNSSGKLFRLEKADDKIKAVSFDNKELEIASENDIETR